VEPTVFNEVYFPVDIDVPNRQPLEAYFIVWQAFFHLTGTQALVVGLTCRKVLGIARTYPEARLAWTLVFAIKF
jgi:hypothetical protein